ncbi:10359_t:CDS:2 [Gigaspora margarita]|uniref:10359_t:CDS:1 n=1 Tax=Gigaspora margarita TaxID=4874 RepID=A0ABM8W248_GIGMA|nr:10359_t:CDS:2 [Gigaspora margarita]
MKPAYIDEHGNIYPNCGQTCGNVIIKNSKTHISSKLNKLFPSIRVLPEKGLNYEKIQNEFLKSMKYVKIVAIVRIKALHEKRIKRSKLKCEMAKFIDQDPQRTKYSLYYGTRANCDPKKVLKNKKICSDQKCEMCSIIKYGTKAKLLRRGKMLFTRRPSIAATSAYNKMAPREHPSTILIIDVLTTNDTSSDVVIIERNAVYIRKQFPFS